MSPSLISLLTALMTVFGIVTLALLLVDTVHQILWSMIGSMIGKDDDRD
jgi:hypothetical protein